MQAKRLALPSLCPVTPSRKACLFELIQLTESPCFPSSPLLPFLKGGRREIGFLGNPSPATLKPSGGLKMTVYDMITERIIRQLEKGEIPWQKPWSGTAGLPKNLQSGKAYRGINLFMLACSGFSSPYWLTFKQCKTKGGSVKAGSQSTPVIFWKFLEKEDAETGESKSTPMLRYYRVFNIDQCQGIEGPKEEDA